MPSLTHAQIAAAHTANTFTNDRITDQSYNHGFFPVFDYSVVDGQPHISVDPKVEVVARDTGISASFADEYGVYLRTRADVQSGQADINKNVPGRTRRLMTVGSVITLVDPDGREAVPLHIRSENVPLAGKVTHQSGLASERPDAALWNRCNQELGLCYLDTESKKVFVIIMQPDKETEADCPQLGAKIAHAKMSKQRAIRLAITKESGIDVTNTEQWDIQMVRLDSKFDFTPEQEASGMVKHVTFSGLRQGQSTTMPAVVHDDPARQTLTLTVPLKVDIPVKLDELIVIDPEGYNRDAGLLSAADFRLLDEDREKNGEPRTIPALYAYIRQLNGKPASEPVAAPVAAPAAAPARV